MSDEIKKTSPAPWLVGGAAVGGLGTYAGLTQVDKLKQYVTEPKYSSHEDILKESHDELVKQAGEAGEETKGYLETAAEARKKIDGAGKAWEAEKADYIKNNTTYKVAEDTEEIKNLQKQLDELKNQPKVAKSPEVKEQSSILEKEIARLRAEAQETAKANLQPKIDEASKPIVDSQNKLNKYLSGHAETRMKHYDAYSAEIEELKKVAEEAKNELKKKAAAREISNEEFVSKTDAINAKLKADKKVKMEGFNKKLAELDAGFDVKVKEKIANLGYSKEQSESVYNNARNYIHNSLAAHEIETAKLPAYSYANTRNEIEAALNEYLAEHNYGTVKKSAYGTATNPKTKDIERLASRNADIKEQVNKYLNTPSGENQKVVKNIIESEKAKLKKAEKFQALYEKFALEAKPEEVEAIGRRFRATETIVDGKKVTYYEELLSKNPKAKEIASFIDNLTSADRADLKRMFPDGYDKEIIGNKVNTLKSRIEKLELGFERYNALQTTIEKEVGKDVYLNGDKLYKKGSTTPIEAPTLKAPEALKGQVALPDNDAVAGLKKSMNNAVNEENIVRKAHRNVADQLEKEGKKIAVKVEDVVDNTAKITELENQIKAKRANLPKTAVESADDLAKKFEELKPKAKYIEEVETAAKNSIKDKFDDFAKKSGVTSNKKLWGFVAAGAVAVGLLAAAIRPKHKEQA